MDQTHNPIPMIRRFLDELAAGNVSARDKPNGYHLGMIRTACEEAERLQGGGWISIADRKPEVSGHYVTWHPEKVIWESNHWIHGYGWTIDSDGVTHWMPLRSPNEF